MRRLNWRRQIPRADASFQKSRRAVALLLALGFSSREVEADNLKVAEYKKTESGYLIVLKSKRRISPHSFFSLDIFASYILESHIQTPEISGTVSAEKLSIIEVSESLDRPSRKKPPSLVDEGIKKRDEENAVVSAEGKISFTGDELVVALVRVFPSQKLDYPFNGVYKLKEKK
jgi:hypothetical protein